MKARVFAAAAVLAGLAVSGAVVSLESQAARAKPRPNVIVIETDDQTQEEMRVMRNTLSLIGAQGTTFDNNFVTLSLCCPSRATFLTGQYAHNNGVLTNAMPTGGFQKLDHTNTLPVWLQRAGYNTALVGKYLNGYRFADGIPPGWTEFHGGVNLGFFNWTLNDNGTLVRYGSAATDYQTDVLSAKAVDVIKRRVPESKPLFMWVTYHAPHSGGPREPDDPTGLATVNVGRYRNFFASQQLPSMPSFNEADVSDKPIGVRNRPVMGAQRVAAIREAYQQQLESLLSVDDGVKAIIDALRAAGELSNTLLVFTDDNGFFHGQHRVPSGKVLLYEPSIRVPLLMRGPGVPKNKHLGQMVANIDLAPTIVALTGATARRKMDGVSLLPLALDPSQGQDRALLLEAVSRNSARPAYEAIRTPRWLWVEYHNGSRELYDLDEDPFQLRSRQGDPALAGVQADLAGRLAALRKCSGAGCRQTVPR